MWTKRLILAAVTAALLPLSGGALPASASRLAGTRPPDPLAAEIERWAAVLEKSTGADEISADARKNGGPALERARQALREGRRLLALQRLGSARMQIEAAEYLEKRTAGQRKDVTLFEAEWKRVGRSIQADLSAPSPDRFASVRSAAIRAIAESTFGQVRPHYEASLDYGRSTTPDSGLIYLGTALSQREFAEFCRTLSPERAAHAPRMRSLAPELDRFEARLLAAYRPPASIDRHTDFIISSASLKDARELDAAGLRYGALLRYLQAAQRFGTLGPPETDLAALKTRLAEIQSALAASASDESVGRLFVEAAQADLSTEGSTGVAASAIVRDVLPLYTAALGPPPPVAARPGPEATVTVTLVRWPYT